MRFTALFAVMAASAAAAQEYEVPGEETTTLTATTTHTITITECAPDYADCPLNKPTTTVVEVPPTTSEVIIPTSEPVYETPIIETPIIETPSLSPVPPPVEPPVETSSSIPHYPVSNSTTHAGPTAPHTTTLLPVPSTVSGNLPIVTETEAVPVPTTPGAAETSEIPQAAAAGVFVQGGLLASMVALGLFGLF